MYYYYVWVRSSRYHALKSLTYSYKEKLPRGTLAQVELQRIKVLGFISGLAEKPRFKTKPISQVYDLTPLNGNLIKLAEWLIDYYPAPLGIITKLFMPRSINPKYLENIPVNSLDLKPPSLPKLTKEQSRVVESIGNDGTYLLHGRTGSGKTRVYIELAKNSLAQNKSVVVLTPEISLTSQLATVFRESFGDKVIIIHSKQTPKDRQISWLKALLSSSPVIVIGPRSAIFSPLQDLGLIIIDEAHEPAFKQDQLPRYLTTRVASKLAALSRSILVIGSATPSITDYFLASEKGKPILEMKQLAMSSGIAQTKSLVVDLKNRDNFIKSPIISDQLLKSIQQSLDKHEQSLLYLNRRGTSRLVVCQNCGWNAVCPNCNLPLVYHGDRHELRCHSCSYKQQSIPSVCPNCGSDDILFQTMGTKAVYEELGKLFPKARIARFDTDNNKAASFHERYEEVKNGEIDIIVGTQQVAKGLDLPKLSTVGVLQADTGLYLPDFSSSERSFQLISQVLGRINRGHIEGRAFVQTYNPDGQLIKEAISQDYHSFYSNEIAQRHLFKFPPYYYLLKLSCRRASRSRAEGDATSLRSEIETFNFPIIVEGPAPAFHEKFNSKFEWQLVVKTTNRNSLLSIVKALPSNWTYDLDPVNLL